MLFVGPGCGIKEGSLDHAVVCLGKGFRFSKSNIGEESLVAAANVITLGPSHSTIFHILEPSGVAHLLIASSLSKVWNHTLELSIGSKEVQNILLSVQVGGVVGIKVYIEIAHEHRGMSVGWTLIKSSLDMSVEIIQSLLAWKQVSSDDRDLPNSGTTKTAHAVVAMTTNVLQVAVRFECSRSSGGAHGKGHTSLSLRVCLGANDLVSIEALGVDDAVRMWVACLLGKAGACKKGESNSHVTHVQEGLLKPTVAATA